MDREQVLKTELAAGHPDTGTYDADHVLAADQINVVNRTRPRPVMSGDALFDATDMTEFDGLTPHQQLLWMNLCARREVNPFGTANVALVVSVFGNPSVTRTALIAARQEAVSRAVELGLGNRVRAGTIEQAREA